MIKIKEPPKRREETSPLLARVKKNPRTQTHHAPRTRVMLPDTAGEGERHAPGQPHPLPPPKKNVRGKGGGGVKLLKPGRLAANRLAVRLDRPADRRGSSVREEEQNKRRFFWPFFLAQYTTYDLGRGAGVMVWYMVRVYTLCRIYLIELLFGGLFCSSQHSGESFSRGEMDRRDVQHVKCWVCTHVCPRASWSAVGGAEIVMHRECRLP